MNAVPRPTSLSTMIVPVELLDDALRDRQAEAEAAALRRHEVVEDRRQPLGAECPMPVSVTLIST